MARPFADLPDAIANTRYPVGLGETHVALYRIYFERPAGRWFVEGSYH